MSWPHRVVAQRGMIPLLLSLLLLVLGCTIIPAAASSPAGFNETLLVRPLPDGKLMMHWEFELSELGTQGRYFRVFPKALGQVLWSLRVHSLSLSLTSGRWLTDQFGYEAYAPAEPHWRTVAENNATADAPTGGLTAVPRPHHTPNGAELWAELADDGQSLAAAASGAAFTPASSVDARWTELQTTLSGLFCASLSQMSAETTSNPAELLRPEAVAGAPSSSFRYATLPRESVCTENLAPFFKLLPCRRERGLAAMLNPLKLFRAHFHSIQFRVHPVFTSRGELDGWILRQSVTVLLDPQLLYRSPSWSLTKMVGTGTEGDGKGAACACSLSQRATLHVQLPPAFAARFPSSVQRLLGAPADIDAGAASFSLGPVAPSRIREAQGHTQFSFDLKRLSSDSSGSSSVLSPAVPSCPLGGLDLSMRYTPAAGDQASSVFAVRDLAELLPSVPSPSARPLEWPVRVERYLNAPSLEDGELFVHVHNPSPSHAMRVQLFDALPWWCQIELHSMALTRGDGSPLSPGDLLHRSYTPALHRSSPAQLSFVFRVAAQSSVSVRVHFTKAMLLTSQYPPDVSRGFDIGSALVHVTPEADDAHGNPLGGATTQWSSSSVLFSTSGLLLLLPFPDFSMPFNVIAFTSTILAFFFGSVLNTTATHYTDVLKRKPSARVGKDGMPVDTSPIGRLKAWWSGRRKQKESAGPTEQTPEAAIERSSKED